MDSTRVRLTDVSIANIGVADRAKTREVDGGVAVEVANGWGREVLRDGRGEAIYPTVTAAKKAVRRHNANIEFERDAVRPSPSMRPPKDR